jgi:DNA-binding response OmpR family regulator
VMPQPAQRILIVDDHAPSRIAVANALTRRGHTCAAVTGACEAVAAISTFGPTVVVAEWAFRDGSGVGLAARLRAENPRLVLIALSHANEPAELHDEYDEYLVKPASPDEIESAFARHSRVLRAV